MPTETRMFVGETGTQAFDGFAGFCIGQVYELQVTRPGNGTVEIGLPRGGPLVVAEADFAKWWVKR